MNITTTRRPIQNTPFRKIINSKAGKLVRDNKVGTGVTAVLSSAALAGGSIQSSLVADVAQYGVIPAVGAGMATLGGAAVHDAVVNDVGENNMKATAKIAGGAASFLAGAEIVGDTFDIPVLEEAFTGVVFDHGASLLGAGLVGGALVAGKAAATQFGKVREADNKAVPVALGTGAAVGSAAAALAGAELVGNDFDIPVLNKALSGTVEFLSRSAAASVVGGGLLLGGAAVAGHQVAENIQNGGNDYITAGLAAGATAGGVGGVELLGHGLGIEATEGLFTQNADIIGSLAVAGLGGAITKHAVDNMRDGEVGVKNSAGLTAGVATLGGGLGLAAASLGADGLAGVIGDGTTVAAGAGLGLTSYAFGKNAVNSAKNGKFGTAAFQGAGAAAAAAGGLTAVGYGSGIDALQQAGEAVYKHTVEPLAEHVVVPAMQFFFDNPVVGGIGLAAVVGGFAYHQLKD